MPATWREWSTVSHKVTPKFAPLRCIPPADSRLSLFTFVARRTALANPYATWYETFLEDNCLRFFWSGEVVLEWPQLSQGLQLLDQARGSFLRLLIIRSEMEDRGRRAVECLSIQD